jgi:transcriptional regulator GlxA family with amidase domain
MESPAVLDSMLARDDVEVLARTARRAHERGAIVASSCSGAFVLGKAGLLDGRSATTTWWLADEFARRFPAARLDVSRALIVDGRVVTAGAVFAQADVALHVVTRLAGPSLARRCSKVLLLYGHAAQAPYMAVAHLRSDDPLIRRAEAWIRAHLAEDFDMATVARRAGTSTRTLSRRLRETLDLSPIGFVQRLRVEAAVHLLETTRLTVEEIGPRVGYADPSSLRRLVRREIRATPSMLRAPP